MKRTRSIRSYADGSARRMGDPPRGGHPLREGPDLRIAPRTTAAPDDAAPFRSPDPPGRSDQESLHSAVRRIAERSATRPAHRSAGTGLAGWLRRQLRKLPFFPR